MMPSASPWQSCLRGSRPAPHLTLNTHLLRSWKWDNWHAHQYTPSSKVYREKHRHYVTLTCWVAALEEEGSALSDQVTGEDSESEVEVVGGINVCLAQAMGQYQQEEKQCFMCGSPGHFARSCLHCEAFR